MSNQPIIIDIVFRSASGRSLLDTPAVREKDLDTFAATEATRINAVNALKQLGFEIIGPATAFGVSVSGSPKLVCQVFGEGDIRVPETLSEWVEAVRIPPSGELYDL